MCVVRVDGLFDGLKKYFAKHPTQGGLAGAATAYGVTQVVSTIAIFICFSIIWKIRKKNHINILNLCIFQNAIIG